MLHAIALGESEPLTWVEDAVKERYNNWKDYYITMRTLFGIIIIALLEASLAMLAAPNASAQWQTVSNSLQGNVNALLASDTDLILASSLGVYRSTDNGADWVALDLQFSQDYPANALLQVSRNTSSPMLFAGTNGGGVYLTTNDSGNWTKLDSGLGGSNVFALVAEGTALFAGTSDGIFLSSDSGVFWHVVDTGVPPGSTISAMTLFNTALFAATDNGLFRSTDAGKTWFPTNTGLGDDSTLVLSFSTLQANGSSALFAGTSFGVYRSTDMGASWVSVSGNLPLDVYFNTIVTIGSTLFLSSNGNGVYLSVDQGTSWNAVNTGLSDPTIYTLAANDSFLFAGAFDGLWRRPLTDFSSSAVAPSISVGNSLVNYPNPFSSSTTINFTTPASGIANVSVVNLLGTEIARIFSGELSAGEHSFSWDAHGTMAGTYWCQIRTNGETEQIPMVLGR
jgi:hypothetical protein